MDTWYSMYPDFDTVEHDFLTVDDYMQISSNPPEDPDMPNFGFTAVLTRSPKLFIQSRTVYTVLEFLGDVGGLDGSLVMIISPLISFFSASMFILNVLNSAFSYDEDKHRQNRNASRSKKHPDT